MTIQFDRLAALGRYLKELPPELLDLDAVITRHDSCGTVACAIGHAALAFPAWWSGAHLSDTGAETYVVWHLPEGRTEDYVQASTHAFGISCADAVRLFAPSGMSCYDGNHMEPPDDQTRFLRRLDDFFLQHGLRLDLWP